MNTYERIAQLIYESLSVNETRRLDRIEKSIARKRLAGQPIPRGLRTAHDTQLGTAERRASSLGKTPYGHRRMTDKRHQQAQERQKNT
jgi:hypothetical protein